MYEWDAADYREHSDGQRKWARELIEKLQLVGTERILDIGCGDGKVTAELTRLVPDGAVVGIDSSESMVRLASETADLTPRMSVRQADARSMAFDEEFDVVFSNAALHWIDDHRSVLSGIVRGLRDGGRVLLQCGGHGNAAKMLTAFAAVTQEPKWRDAFRDMSLPWAFYGPDEYTKWLDEAGLEAESIELVPRDLVHADVSGLTGWLRTTWLPFTQRVPPEQQESLLCEVVDEYLKRVPIDEEGRTHVSMVRLEVSARKC